jgi:predicted Zn-ribbon and HTH transcriptional regulator
VNPDAILFGYVVLVLAALSALALYTEHRQRRFGPTPTDDRVFRCTKCGYVYTDDPDVDRSRCQQCGTQNEAIKF